MICERCQSDEVRIVDTAKYDDRTIRTYICLNCDCKFKTYETKKFVRHYNPVTLKADWVEVLTYRKKELWNCNFNKK